MDSPHWATRWRRVGRFTLACGVIGRLGVAFVSPTNIIVSLCLAASAARLSQIIWGMPNTRPDGRSVGLLLTDLGYRVRQINGIGAFRKFSGYHVELSEGGRLFVKVLSRDSWATLVPVRLYRTLRYRDPGHDQPFRSMRSIVEHEALCALKAHSDGVPTARLAAVSEVAGDSMLIAFDSRPYVTLAELDESRRTPSLLAEIWRIVALLQRSHTVHGRLNAESVLVDEDDNVVVVEFTSASIGVVGPRLSTDVAEVLAATSARIGPSRAVQAAVEGVGSEVVASALPRLQPLALSVSTRHAVKQADCLPELREEVQRVTGVDASPVAELERIKPQTLITVAMAALALWTLIPQLVGVSAVWDKLAEANWWWAVAALGLSMLSYLGAAISLDGSLTERLPLGPNTAVQLATSFVGVAAPGGALAITGRFLQKRGVDTNTAASAVGLNTIAGVVVHLSLTGIFIGLAGTSGLRTFKLPSLSTLGFIALGIVLVVAVTFFVPRWRSFLGEKLIPPIRRSVTSVADVARVPSKLMELFGGSLAITLSYAFAFVVSVEAFGTGPAFTAIVLVYLVGSILSSVAPTPGGIGAVEATLIAGLTSAGMASTSAVGAVMLFRFATFWVPLLPGWIALVVLQRTGDL